MKREKLSRTRKSISDAGHGVNLRNGTLSTVSSLVDVEFETRALSRISYCVRRLQSVLLLLPASAGARRRTKCARRAGPALNDRRSSSSPIRTRIAPRRAQNACVRACVSAKGKPHHRDHTTPGRRIERSIGAACDAPFSLTFRGKYGK